ncbi:hypothetical protein FLL45_17650 [Aliikangiella marina]|uniref:Type 4a pilus biogenesis protein PilO n=1 Tax=Aliikangiella marina TaxID=1712262 RepID=A0A545T4E9_9GAMM|nr:hypothetical protein [Aliikangiella marina]TQV71995.1 hypothetical protein FLL45_17370 [Aliikangiella marina]TQV72048.1 hypothetical protein FLL45_17650 [Aliikangiella marina]
MDKLKKSIQQFDELPIRTRLMITFAGLLLILVIFELAWYGPTDSQTKTVKQQIDSTEKQIASTTQMLQELNKGIYNQRNNPKQTLLSSLDQQVDQIQSELEKRTRSLVRPQAMAGLLKEIIDNSKQLKLLSLEKQAPVPLYEPTADEDGTSQDAQVQMYRHPIVMIFEGGYADTQAFLKQLESMQQKVNFESFEFSVESYPKSKVTLVVSTYSLSRKWIGG